MAYPSDLHGPNQRRAEPMTSHASGSSFTLAALVTALSLIGCTGTDSEASGSPGPEDGQMTASVAPVGESGVQGTARITPGADSVTLKLELLGVAEGATYTPRLLEGGCTEEAESVSELDPPHVGTVGVGSSLTRLPAEAVSSEASYAVAVEGADGDRLACGAFRPGVGG